MDGIQAMMDVTVIAATNRPLSTLDPALLRAGRFDKIIAVTTPDHLSRLAILRIHTVGMPLDNDVNLEQISQAVCITHSMSAPPRGLTFFCSVSVTATVALIWSTSAVKPPFWHSKKTLSLPKWYERIYMSVCACLPSNHFTLLSCAVLATHPCRKRELPPL